jgi:hypothetical protein
LDSKVLKLLPQEITKLKILGDVNSEKPRYLKYAITRSMKFVLERTSLQSTDYFIDALRGSKDALDTAWSLIKTSFKKPPETANRAIWVDIQFEANGKELFNKWYLEKLAPPYIDIEPAVDEFTSAFNDESNIESSTSAAVASTRESKVMNNVNLPEKLPCPCGEALESPLESSAWESAEEEIGRDSPIIMDEI